MTRVSPAVQKRLDEIEQLQLQNPTSEDVLIGIVDDLAADHIESVPNNDGYFQLLMGFPKGIDLSTANDVNLRAEVITCIRNAVKACGLTPADFALIDTVLSRG